VLGDKWEPAVVLIQGLAGAAAIQQLGYNWFTFYRARGDSSPQAVESAALVVGFFGLAIPGLAVYGFDGFVWGRVAASVLVLCVRWVYVRRLLPRVSLASLAARGLAPVTVGAGAALTLRLALWGGDRSSAQAIAELTLFLAGTAAATWLLERGLLRELSGYLASSREPVPAST
jgi:hypothetical protein